MKPSLADIEYQDNANSNPDLPLISMNEPSPHSSDDSTSETIPLNNNNNDYDIDPIDIDNDDNDDLNYDVDDGGFGFDDFMNNAMETPWRKTPNNNNENNNISKKKQVVSKKDNKGQSSKDDLISMVERARLKLGRQDSNVDDIYTQQVPSKVKSVPTVAVPKAANELYDDNIKSSVSLNANLPLNMFLKAGPVRPFLRQSNESIKTVKKKKKSKIVTEPIITTNTVDTRNDKSINNAVAQDDKENVVNKLNPPNITKSSSTKRKYLNASNIKYAFDYVQPNSKATNDNYEEEEEANESVDEDEEDAYERALNFECEMLRTKLAAKLSAGGGILGLDNSVKKVNNNQNEDTKQDNDMQDTDNNSHHDNNSNNDSNDSNNSIYLEEPNNNNIDYYFDYDYSQKNNNSNDNNNNNYNNDDDDDDEDDEAIERENQLLRAAIEMKRKIIL